MSARLTATVTAFVLAASGSVCAADIPVKAPPAAPAPIYNWTGWYAGVNLGASFGRVKTEFNVDPVTVSAAGRTIATIPGFDQSDVSEPSGFIGGGQIGYNWQLSPIWVVGLEADIQGALEKDRATLTSSFNVSQPLALVLAPSVTGTAVTDYQTKIDWFGTVRGRIGYVWGDGAVISYVTGGLAYGKVELDATNTVSGTVGTFPFSTTHAITHSHINTGWTVGYGAEGKLLIPGWTYKIEGLYVDLGPDPVEDLAILNVNASGGLLTGHARFTDTILRAGLNYQFH